MPDTELAPAKQSADNALIAMIVTAAQTNSIEIDKLKELMVMRKEILAHEAEVAFNLAMNAVQSEIEPVRKDAENTYSKSRYATLEKVDRELRPIYTKHGFSLTFNSGTPAQVGAIHVICEVRHTAGHKKEYYLEGDLDVSGAQGKSNKTSIQGLGSTVSYLRRYLTLMVFNVTLTNEDNDGNGNREAYTKMRQEADAKQAARQAAEQAVPAVEIGNDNRFYRQPEPGLQPPHDEQLRDSIKEFGVRPTKKSPKKIDILQAFGALKKKLTAINRADAYYATLGSYGAIHSSDFSDTPAGIKQARECYAEMRIVCADLEVEADKAAQGSR